MADTIRTTEHHHYQDGTRSSANSFLLGVILLAIVLFALFYWGGNLISGVTNTAPQVNIPREVDVNVNNKTNPGQ